MTITFARFKKRPVEVTAVQWDGTVEGATSVINWVLSKGGVVRYVDYADDEAEPFLAVNTLEGQARASSQDWIIQGVKGEFYPCKPDIFEASYDAVEQPH